MQNLQELPKLVDSIGFLYVEHAVIEKDDASVAVIQKDGRIPLPIAEITCLALGPGTSITHAAIKVITESGCNIVWCGDAMGRFYACGTGETRSSRNLLVQAKCCMNDTLHMAVVRKMYAMRFPDVETDNLTLQQIRGLEGIRIRRVYQQQSERTGVEWTGRSYRTEAWNDADPINRALSTANSLLYGICHSAIVSLGYSTGLGFIHTGKQLSFVYDVADLYKTETTIPAAFEAVQTGQDNYPQLRKLCRQYFYDAEILNRIPKDLSKLFEVCDDEPDNMDSVGDLWDNDSSTVDGGVNYDPELTS